MAQAAPELARQLAGRGLSDSEFDTSEPDSESSGGRHAAEARAALAEATEARQRQGHARVASDSFLINKHNQINPVTCDL